MRICLIFFIVLIFDFETSFSQKYVYDEIKLDSKISFLSIGEMHRDTLSNKFEELIIDNFIRTNPNDSILLFLEYASSFNTLISKYRQTKDTSYIYDFFSNWSKGTMSNYTLGKYKFCKYLLDKYELNHKVKIVCIDAERNKPSEWNNENRSITEYRDSIMYINIKQTLIKSKNYKFIFICGMGHNNKQFISDLKLPGNNKSVLSKLVSDKELHQFNFANINIQSKYYTTSKNKKYKSIFYGGLNKEQFEMVNSIDFKSHTFVFIDCRAFLNNNYGLVDYILLNKNGHFVGD